MLSFRFGQFTLDLERGTLLKGGSNVPLRPQSYRVLKILLENHGRLVPRVQLQREIWGDSVVTDDSLTHCLIDIRKAIGDTDKTVIRTVPRRGFIFDAPVEVVGDDAASLVGGSARSDSSPAVRRVWVNPLLFAAAAIVVIAVWWATREGAETAVPADDQARVSIAVLPFEDLSPDLDQAYLGNGIADELRLELQRLDGLRVAGRSSSNAYAQSDSKTIGEALNVESVLEGSVRKDGNSVRITVHLTDAAGGFSLWSDVYDGELKDVFELQEEIATEVAGSLGISLGVGSVNAFHGAGTRNVDAYEAYLQASNLQRPGRTGENAEAISLMERAIQLDPHYGAAYSNLAFRMLNKTWGAEVSEARQFIAKAHEFALKGVELEPESAFSHNAMAVVQYVQLDWSAAERHITRAVELLDDRPSLESYAMMLMRSGRMSEAERKFIAALNAEPMDGRPHGQIWHVYLTQQRFSEAREVASWQHEIGLEVVFNNIDIAFSKEGDANALKTAIRALPETHISFVHLYGPLLSEIDSPESTASILRQVYRDQDSQWNRKLHDLAMVAAYVGDAEFALIVKTEEIRKNPLRITALWHPVMSGARQLPAFRDFVTEINLVEYWRAYGWADVCRPLNEEDFECL